MSIVGWASAPTLHSCPGPCPMMTKFRLILVDFRRFSTECCSLDIIIIPLHPTRGRGVAPLFPCYSSVLIVPPPRWETSPPKWSFPSPSKIGNKHSGVSLPNHPHGPATPPLAAVPDSITDATQSGWDARPGGRRERLPASRVFGMRGGGWPRSRRRALLDAMSMVHLPDFSSVPTSWVSRQSLGIKFSNSCVYFQPINKMDFPNVVFDNHALYLYFSAKVQCL